MPAAARRERKQIIAIVRGLEEGIERRCVRIGLNVLGNLVRTTPVDTGWAKSNWTPKLRRPYRARTRSRGNPSKARARQEQGQAEMLGFSLDDKRIWVSNNVPYIEALNNGHSKQAPAGFVQRAVLRAAGGQGGVTVEFPGG